MAIQRMQQRRGTAAEWTAEDTTLNEGEMGYESDTGKWKWGDGTTPWSGLEYQPTPGSTAGDAGVYHPDDFGAAGDNTADDTAELNAFFAACLADGKTANLWNRDTGDSHYRATGPVYMIADKIMGLGTDETPDTTVGSIIRCDGATAVVYAGRWATTPGNPSLISGLIVDGNGSGDPAGILRVQAESATLVDVVVRDAVGDGVVLDHAQNCTFINLKVSECHDGTAVSLDMGAGGNTFLGGHWVDNEVGVAFQQDSGAPAGSQFTYNNTIQGVILESYLTDVTRTQVEVDGGVANRFRDCGISTNADPTTDLALVRVLSSAFQPQVAFSGCWFVGHNTAVDFGIDVIGASIALVEVDSQCSFLNVAAAIRNNSTQAAIHVEGIPRLTPVATVPLLDPPSTVGSLANVTQSKAPKITRYNTAQTDTPYAIDPTAKFLIIRCAGAGGGGGGGRRDAAGTARMGGGGGGGGAFCEYVFVAADVYSYVTDGLLYLTVGAGGTAGAAAAGDTSSGGNGGVGGASWVALAASATIADLLCLSNGGGAGVGGTTAVGTGGAQGAGSMFGGNGGSAGAAGGAGAAPTVAGQGGAGQGGGAGGGITAANAQSAGGAGQPPYGRWNTITATGGTAGGGAGVAGAAPVFLPTATGGGGGGGGSNSAGAGGAGGAGGRASGGGGGGASVNGSASGAGGVGGAGYVEVIAVY